MQRYTMLFVTKIALHVSSGSSAHHQELKTYTQHRVFSSCWSCLNTLKMHGPTNVRKEFSRPCSRKYRVSGWQASKN